MLRSMACVVICIILCIGGSASAAEPGPWATYRGNPARTGNTDNRPVRRNPPFCGC